MKTPKYTLAFIKIQAKKLKKQKGIGQRQALEVIAREQGYPNWKECLRILSLQILPETKQLATVPISVSFTDWLKRHKNRDSPLGDLACDMLRDKEWPAYDTLKGYETYLERKDATWLAIEALKKAWRSYKSYLRVKASSNKPQKKTSRPVDPNLDTRKITFVKNAKPIHFKDRIAEEFNAGDKAWVSWDGRKAIPVTILTVDTHNYTFRNERPRKSAGNVYSLFLDEVRSTPELACTNRRTS